MSRTNEMETGLPPVVAEAIAAKVRSGWSGTLTLNFKDGKVLSYEVTEKHRLTK